MTHWFKATLLGFVFLMIANPSFGRSNIRLSNFKAGAIRVSPQEFPSAAFIDLGWTPIVELDPFGLRGEFSFTGARNKSQDRFFITNYEAYAMFTIVSVFVFEAGGGMQYWHGNNGGAAPVASGGIAFRCGEFLDRLYIDYSYVFRNGNPTKVYMSGFGFNF